jgi:hypothetical protein
LKEGEGADRQGGVSYNLPTVIFSAKERMVVVVPLAESMSESEL